MLLPHDTLPSEEDTQFWQQCANACNMLAAHSKEYVFCGELSGAVQCQIKKLMSPNTDLCVAIKAVLLHDVSSQPTINIGLSQSKVSKRVHAAEDTDLFTSTTASQNNSTNMGSIDSSDAAVARASKMAKLSVSTSTTDLAAMGRCSSQTDLAAIGGCPQHRHAACV